MKNLIGKRSRFPVFHVPHDGRQFPEDLTESVCVPEEVFLRYHEKMRDTDISRAVPEACRGGDMYCSFPVSRLLCDVERFIGPEEVMERYGMGFCYEKVYDGTIIKQVTEAVRERTLRYYREHHDRMDRICRRHPRNLLFDLHSYSDEIVPDDFLREGVPVPDLCIGADEKYTPPELTETVRKRFAGAGFGTAVNYPYAGCYVPNAVWQERCSCDCVSVMLEFHKRTYCDGNGKSIPGRLRVIRKLMEQVAVDCAEL